MSHIDDLVQFAGGITDVDVPAGTRAHLDVLLRDVLTVALAGHGAPGCPAILELAREWQVANGASVLYSDMVLPPPQAAMINATLCEAWDYDDTHDRGLVHTSAPVLAAALAAAQWTGKPVAGPEFLTATAMGIEVLCRLGMASRSPLTWTRTSTLGAIAAAAAAGRVLGLSAQQLQDAMGIAYTQSAGNSQTIADSATSKKMQVGFAARAGVLSAMLASRGLTGPRDILEGRYGYYRLYEDDVGPLDEALSRLGSRWELDEVAIKPFPCARDNHSSLAATVAATAGTPIAATEIATIEVWAPKLAVDVAGKAVTATGPQAAVSAILSIPYTVAVAAVRGTVRLEDFRESSISDPAIQAVQERVQVEIDADAPPTGLAPASARITLTRGDVLEGKCSDMPGTSSWLAEHPHVLQAKRDDCTSMAAFPSADDRLRLVEDVLQAGWADEDLPRSLTAVLALDG